MSYASSAMGGCYKNFGFVEVVRPFGRKVVVLGGDFRQILPVISKGSRADIVGSTVTSSYLWKYCKVGDGTIDTIDEDETTIEIPSDLLIGQGPDPLLELVNFAYPDLVANLESDSYFQERAILAPTLESVEHVNNYILSKLPGVEREYLSYDTPCRSDEDSEVHAGWLTSEFLNDVQCSGIPNHRLILKEGVPIMLLRNIDQAGGIMLGKTEYILRITLTPSDSGLPFKFSRRQFLVTLCFAMTINKSQGHSLSHVGLYLPMPVFTHGQLYVALSRVKSRIGLKVLIVDEQGVVSTSTRNVVYKKVFENV
ncbi:uncharacterized protein LOC130726103 [Lotus japonicus]|uniref:uncharacterized protein LOC130726103 n=1 Tax=Lotus japonicus TaxID=34305 RepID=UPI0025835553|nr:uncharacterized protein LOC130726103 [Lotus japonicus]